jgi:hypothetical protein
MAMFASDPPIRTARHHSNLQHFSRSAATASKPTAHAMLIEGSGGVEVLTTDTTKAVITCKFAFHGPFLALATIVVT